MAKKALEGLADIGEVNLFGLNEFGAAEGTYAAVGSAVGAFAQGILAAQIRSRVDNVSVKENAEVYGAAAAAALSAAGLLSPKTRNAAWAGIGAALGAGLAQVVNKMMAAKSLSGVEIDQIPTLRGVTIDPIPTLRGSGLGLTTMQAVPTLNGAMPQLVGSAGHMGATRQQQATLVGAPTLNGMASAFGATLFGN